MNLNLVRPYFYAIMTLHYISSFDLIGADGICGVN